MSDSRVPENTAASEGYVVGQSFCVYCHAPMRKAHACNPIKVVWRRA